MSFPSVQFALFLAVVYLVALLVGSRWRWIVLLVGSYVFYAVLGVPYLLAVLCGVTVVAWGCGFALARASTARARTSWLVLGLVLQVGTLIVLRYTGFLLENLVGLLGAFGVRASISTSNPFVFAGVSFYVFQGISYVLDIYLERIPPEKHLGIFALHMALFAKLMQGPIERGGDLIPQLREPCSLRLSDLIGGLRLFAWGLFKKSVVADRLALLVAPVYSDVNNHHGLSFLLATYLFAAQLLFDFSGYTDMARGVGRVFGLELRENFRTPYLASSIADFWRRWHISFSSWILDYIFRPLQIYLRNVRTWGTPLALLATFLISGMWHGASWTFVVWGGLHGTYMAAAVLWDPTRRRLRKRFGLKRSLWAQALDVLISFHWVCLAWVFFRATTVAAGIRIVSSGLLELPSSLLQVVRGQDVAKILFLGQDAGMVSLTFSVLLVAALGPLVASGLGNRFPRLNPWARSLAYAAMFYLFAFHGVQAQSFVYAQF